MNTLKKIYISVIILLCGLQGYGVTCTSQIDGAWGDAGMWDCPGGPSLSGSDTIIIATNVTNGSISVDGSTVLIINDTLSISGTWNIISETAEIEVNGYVTSTGSFTAETGTINVNGTFEITSGDYILSNGTGGNPKPSSMTYVNSGGTLDVSGDVTFNSSNSSINQASGSTINATNLNMAGSLSETDAVFAGTVNLSGDFVGGSAARQVDISGTFNAVNFTTAQGTINMSGDMNLTGDFASTGTSFIDITGSLDAEDLRINGGGTFTGTPTLNLRDLNFGWGSPPYATSGTFSGSVNWTGGDINVSRYLTVNGGAVINVGADLSVGSDFYGGGSNGITFDSTSYFGGNFYKTGSGAITVNDDMTIDGYADMTNGGSTPDLLIADGTTFKATHFYVTGNFNTTLNGFMDISRSIRMGISQTDSSTSVGGSVAITGTGVIGWAPDSLFTNGSSGTYIGCVGHTASSGRHGEGPLSAYPDAPANPLDLSTCAEGSLPVSLIYFKGEAEPNYIRLYWETVSEDQNKEFIIEKSDGGEFYPIGSVPGAGTSNSLLSYSFDHYGEGGYFRLKQVDFEGGYSYSDIIFIDQEEERNMTVYPNPCDGLSFFVKVHSEDNGQVRIKNISGAILPFTKLSESNNTIEISSAGLKPGIYIIEVRGNTGIYIDKIVIK